ncbi:DUF2278 family protein [Streptomyces sp. NPDC047000]|uniref:DUF2278 family protein n=1 Tax=Streptomyces sp. NPDC047000 TaxID=3155474 RepID=UPI0033DCF506
MPLKSYGVLIAKAVGVHREGNAQTPHYQIHLVDDAGTEYRAAVNVKSQESPSELLYFVADDFRHPVTARVADLPKGWNSLPPGPGGANLDFVRGNLFDPAAMRPLPPDVAGPDNDLADLLDHYVQRAITDDSARLYVFGERWGPEPGVKDKIFGFLPGNGVHDVHMNQGNSPDFAKDDGTWQDGGLLVHFPGQNRWVGVFLAFQSQKWHTDDTTGHTVPEADGTRPGPGTQPVRIAAALLNPRGPAPARQTVTLINASPEPVDLTGWHITDHDGTATPVPPGPLAPGTTRLFPLTDGTRPPGQGGGITLLDAHGLKAHGVSYTTDQTSRVGWTTVF